MAYDHNAYIRNEIERLVLGNIAEHATFLHSFLAECLKDKRSNLCGVELPHTLRCLGRHQAYALKRLEWWGQRAKAAPHAEKYRLPGWAEAGASHVDEYRLPGWERMTTISNGAFHFKLKLKAINELIDAFGVIPVSFGAWCVPVRENLHDNWYSCGAIVNKVMFTVASDHRGWQMRKVLVNPNWEKESYDYMTSTVKRRTGRERVSLATPIPAMLMVAIKSTFKGLNSC